MEFGAITAFTVPRPLKSTREGLKGEYTTRERSGPGKRRIVIRRGVGIPGIKSPYTALMAKTSGAISSAFVWTVKMPSEAGGDCMCTLVNLQSEHQIERSGGWVGLQ